MESAVSLASRFNMEGWKKIPSWNCPQRLLSYPGSTQSPGVPQPRADNPIPHSPLAARGTGNLTLYPTEVPPIPKHCLPLALLPNPHKFSNLELATLTTRVFSLFFSKTVVYIWMISSFWLDSLRIYMRGTANPHFLVRSYFEYIKPWFSLLCIFFMLCLVLRWQHGLLL